MSFALKERFDVIDAIDNFLMSRLDFNDSEVWIVTVQLNL